MYIDSLNRFHKATMHQLDFAWVVVKSVSPVLELQLAVWRTMQRQTLTRIKGAISYENGHKFIGNKFVSYDNTGPVTRLFIIILWKFFKD